MAKTVAQAHAPKGPIKGRPITPIKGSTYHQLCTAHSARTGKPCRRAPILGGTVCVTHGGAAPQVKAKAKERLTALFPKSVHVFDRLLDREEFPTVQFQTARFIAEQEVGRATEHAEHDLSGEVMHVLRWGGV